MKNSLTPERLRQVLSYETDSGVFRWIASVGVVKQGAIAGCKGSHGYIQICIDRRLYLAHRLAWLYVHGSWPTRQLDHIDGDKKNNRIVNLREVTNAENHQNTRRPRSNSQSGFLGVSLHKQTGRWLAQIMVLGRKKHLGLFDTAEEAHGVYLAAKSKLHPFQTLVEAA